MRKSITLILALASLLVVLFAGTALAGTTVVEPLMAGQNTQVGTVTISDDGTSLTVEYDISEDGWFLSTTHVYVGLKAPAKSAPGQFPYKHEGVYDTTDTFVVPIVDGKTYYVAAHADVVNENNIVGWDCPTLEEVAASLPDSGVIRVDRDLTTPSYVTVSLSSSTLNGDFPAWCIDAAHGGNTEQDYAARFYPTFGPLPDYLTTGTDPAVDEPENLDLASWVLNNQDGYGIEEVQNVLWYLIDDVKPALTAREQELVAAAFANGEGFVPDFCAGDVFVFIVAPVPAAGELETVAQVMLAPLPVECTPIYQSETAWAQGNLFWKTGWGSYIAYNS